MLGGSACWEGNYGSKDLAEAQIEKIDPTKRSIRHLNIFFIYFLQ